MELGRLALYHSLNQPGISTCLVGMNDIDTLHTNLNILNTGLSDTEREVLQEIQER